MEEMPYAEVTRATADDAAAAWRIVNEYYDAVQVVVREDEREFIGYYFGPGSGVWLARIEDDVVGCIALRPLDSPSGAAAARAGTAKLAEVKRLYVKPVARGRGVAAQLLEALQNYARDAGYSWLYLDSKDDLHAALAFYEKYGYQRCERYNENPQATVFMRLKL
jgi:GNAT superfamily N-acetyltransferase